jgi:DMSO/TMAO reductase YedYZ heme-binding membrane subunit
MEFVSYATSWNQLFLNIVNKILCTSAITMLAIVYMPSNLACIFQLAYGTRERRFPNWLDRWLLGRKQLGLLTFLIALTHSIMTLILMSPAYYSTWFHPVEIIIPTIYNQTQFVVEGGLMTAKGELASLLGILTQLCMSILAVTSIPAIGNLLNWREWRFVQSKLGTVTLLLAIGHVVAMALPRWIAVGVDKAFYNLGLLCLYFPLLTLLLKFMFWLPCLSRPLYRIRCGQNTKETSQP